MEAQEHNPPFTWKGNAAAPLKALMPHHGNPCCSYDKTEAAKGKQSSLFAVVCDPL
jgi:hypothetical protein